MEYILNIAYVMSIESFPQLTQFSHKIHLELVLTKQYVFNSAAVAPNGANN